LVFGYSSKRNVIEAIYVKLNHTSPEKQQVAGKCLEKNYVPSGACDF